MVISRVIIRVTPFRARITLLITYLLSPLPLQVEGPGCRIYTSGLRVGVKGSEIQRPAYQGGCQNYGPMPPVLP